MLPSEDHRTVQNISCCYCDKFNFTFCPAMLRKSTLSSDTLTGIFPHACTTGVSNYNIRTFIPELSLCVRMGKCISAPSLEQLKQTIFPSQAETANRNHNREYVHILFTCTTPVSLLASITVTNIVLGLQIPTHTLNSWCGIKVVVDFSIAKVKYTLNDHQHFQYIKILTLRLQ